MSQTSAERTHMMTAPKKMANPKKRAVTAPLITKKKMMVAKQRRLRKAPVAAMAVESAHPHLPWIAEAHPVANPRGVKEILADIERDFAPIMARLAQ